MHIRIIFCPTVKEELEMKKSYVMPEMKLMQIHPEERIAATCEIFSHVDNDGDQRCNTEPVFFFDECVTNPAS